MRGISDDGSADINRPHSYIHDCEACPIHISSYSEA